MALPSTSNSHRDFPIAEGARFVASPDDSVNFLLNIPREDLSSYMRSGNDLVIAFRNGTSLQIADFFLRGVDAQHLIVIDGNTRWGVSLTPQTMGDGALDAAYEAVEDDSSSTLLGILGAVGLIAAASAGGGESAAAPPPARPVIDTVSGQRTASGDFLTGKETVDVVGHGAVPNAKLSVFVDGVLAGTTVADAKGQWTYTAAKLSEGMHAISVTQTDAAGKTSEPAAVNVVVDTIAPPAPQIDSVTDDVGTIVGLLGQGSSTDDSTPTLSGNAEAGSTVRIFDGSMLIGALVVGATGRWSFTPPALDEGLHRLTLTATDAAGNVSDASEPFVFTVDTAPPKLDGIEVSAAARPTITGHTEPGSIVRIYQGDNELGQTKADAQGNWRFQPKLSDGDHHLAVTATDAAGNQSPRSPVDLTVDTTAPVLEIIGVSAAPRPTITGRAEPGSIVKVYHGDTELGRAQVDEDGNWRFQPHLKDGDYDLTVTATDAQGNQSRRPVDLVVDTTPPVLEIIDVSAGVSPVITGRAEQGSIVKVFNGTTLLGEATADDGGNWQFQTAITYGSHHLTVTATDAVGNKSAGLPVHLSIETSPPEVETPPEETEVSEGEGEVSFESEDGTDGTKVTVGTKVTDTVKDVVLTTVTEVTEVTMAPHSTSTKSTEPRAIVKIAQREDEMHVLEMQVKDAGAHVDTSGNAMPEHALLQDFGGESALLPGQLHAAHSMDAPIDIGLSQSSAEDPPIHSLLSGGQGGAVGDVAVTSSLFLPDTYMDTLSEVERGSGAMTMGRETADLDSLLAHQALVV